MTALVALDSQKHHQLKLVTDTSYPHAKARHLLPIAVHEFALAATNFPIVFVKDSETGQFRSCVLTGLKPQQNLFCKNDAWLGSYVPECLRHYPLAAVKVNDANDSDRFVICIDESSPLVSTQDGDALFNDAKASEFLNRRGEAAVNWAQKNTVTQSFINRIVELKLIQPQSLTINNKDGKPYELTGCYIMNEALLNQLSDAEFIGLKQAAFLGPIYAALISLNQVNNLLKLAD